MPCGHKEGEERTERQHLSGPIHISVLGMSMCTQWGDVLSSHGYQPAVSTCVPGLKDDGCALTCLSNHVDTKAHERSELCPWPWGKTTSWEGGEPFAVGWGGLSDGDKCWELEQDQTQAGLGDADYCLLQFTSSKTGEATEKYTH